MNDNDDFDFEDRPQEEIPPPERAPAWLAVVRIVCVLGMSTCIALGIFLLLLPAWQGLAILAGAVPFFAIMRYVEMHATAEEGENPWAE